MPQTPIVERAYALAQTGQFAGVDPIKRRLAVEGYEGLGAWFQSRTFKSTLQTLCRQAASTGREPPAP